MDIFAIPISSLAAVRTSQVPSNQQHVSVTQYLLRLVHKNKYNKDVTLELLEDMGVNLIEDNSNEASAQEPVNSNPKINLNLILKVSEYE